MTVTTTANSISYVGNGTTTAFAFPYIFFAPSDLVVTLAVTATGTSVSPAPVLNGAATYDYTVNGVLTDGEYASGGAVTFNTAPLGSHTVSLVRSVPAIQTVTLIDNAKFPANTVNAEFDYLTVLVQQALAVTGTLGTTVLQIPGNEAGLIVTAVPAANRANQLLLWDGLGNLTTIDPATLIGGAVPSGPAGGDLRGTYPNPAIKPNVALSGSPTTTTQSVATSNTTVATTAFVTAYVGQISGRLLQTVSFETGAVATGTTIIPVDDTIPQITEGDQYMSLAITPQSATSKLVIEALWQGSFSATGAFLITVALFQDATAGALAATWAPSPASGAAISTSLRHVMTSGTTSATTFKIRVGGNTAGTTTFNGFGGGRLYGGVMASSIVIREIAP
jgi:hypothetical protein